MAIAHELIPTVPWDVSWWANIVEVGDPLDPIGWDAPLCGNWLALNRGSCRSITIATQFPTPAAARSKASANRFYGNLEQYPLSAISALAERAVAALMPR